MSWFGGSLSSLTGQLSNLTKDILTEGTEEVSDHATELRLAQEKLKELDALCTSQKIENERLKHLVQEAEEKAESSELQINSISREYRTLLEGKENEIKALKQQQHEKAEFSSSFASEEAGHPAILRLSSDGFDSIGFQGDEHDFSDNIAMQQEVNLLRGNVQKLQAECQHWKTLCQQNKSAEGVSELEGIKGENSELHRQIQELQQQLLVERDERQSQLSSLQDAHAHKVTALRKRHKEEVTELKRKISELDWGSEGWESQTADESTSLKQTISSLQEEIAKLRLEREDRLQEITGLNNTIEDLKSEMAIMEAKTISLETQLKVSQEEISKLQSDHDQKKELTEAVSKLEKQQKVLDQEAAEMVAELGDPQHQKLTADIIDTLEEENLLLRKKNVELQEQVTLLEKAVQNITKEKQDHGTESENKENTTGESGIQGQDSENFSDSTSFTSDLSELSRRNTELDEQVTNLKSQIGRYEVEIEQFEMLQSDWQNEKEALEGVLMQLREQLKEKENSLNVIEAQKGMMSVEQHEHGGATGLTTSSETLSENGSESFENIADDIIKLDGKVTLLTEANARLERQRDKLIIEKEKLHNELNEVKKQSLLAEQAEQREKDTRELKEHLQEKETELQLLMEEKEDLERNLALLPDLKKQLKQKEEEVENLLKITSVVGEEAHQNEIEKTKKELKTLEEEISKHIKEKEELETANKEMEELKRKLRNKDMEVVNLTLEKEEMMNSLEELDGQHQVAMTQIISVRDNLSKSNEELQTKLRKSESELQALKSEFDNFKQQHIINQSVDSSDSNELNHQIAELKEENNELRQKVNNCDTTILELTEEIMLKDSEIEEMKAKVTKSATVLNDLHMDKQELEKCVAKLKEEISSKAQQLKKLKENIETSVKTDTFVQRSDSFEETVQAEQSIPLSSSSHSEVPVEMRQLRHELKMQESQLQGMKTALSEKTSEYIQVQSDNQAFNLELENVRKSNEKLMTECESLNNALKIKESNYEELQALVAEKSAEIANLKEELVYTQNDRDKLQKDNDRKTSECESFSRQIHSIEAHTSSLKDKIVELEKSHKSDLQNIKDLNERLDVLNNENLAQKQKYEEEISVLQEEIDLANAEKLHRVNELDELERLNETLNSELALLKEVINEKDRDCDGIKSLLQSASNELAVVREELNKRDAEIASLTDELNAVKLKMFEENEKEIDLLKSQIKTLQKEKEDLQDIFDKDICDLKEEHETEMSKIQEENNVLIQGNKDLKKNITDLETHYQTYIEKLKANNDSDHSSLDTLYNQAVEESHKKDLQLSSQDTRISSLQEQLKVCNEKVDSLQLSRKQISDSLNVKEKENNDIKDNLKTVQDEKLKMQQEKRKLEEQYAKERTMHLTEIEEFKTQLETVSDYESLKQRISESDKISSDQVKMLEEKVKVLESEVASYKQTIKDHEFGIAALNKEKLQLMEQLEKEKEKWEADEGMLHVLKQTSVQKEIEIKNLERKLHRAKSLIDEEQHMAIENEIIPPNYDLPALEYKEKGEIEPQEVCETVQPLKSAPLSMINQENFSTEEAEQHKIDVSREIDRLKNQLNEKDDVINELQRNTASLLKMLESKSKSSGGDINLLEMHRLESEAKTLRKEREQMMDVMNEKSKEVSSLKAEVHRLMNIVSAEKAAIEKLQSDSQVMSKTATKSGENHMDDMQKEAVQNLSRLIRDKDLEIESLKQKNETLLSVLQESSQEGNQINSLMADKDNLSRQLAALQTEREQMIAYLTQKHQESVANYNEVQRLTAVINAETAKHSQITLEYENLVPQFEDKTQALLKAQNELINYKQKYTELEVKYGQLLHQSNIEESVDKATFNSKAEELSRLQERYKELMDSVKEKEMKIQNLHQSINELEQNFRSADHEKGSYKKQVDNFVFQLQGLQNEQKDLRAEIEHLKAQKVELINENKSLKDLNNKLTLQMQERDFEIKSLQEKTTTLTSFLQERQGDQSQLHSLMQEKESTQQHIKQIQGERDQALIALQQKQTENDHLRKDVQILNEREAKLKRELDRLRQHLIQIEDTYTKEALLAEERETELRNRLSMAEENILSNTSAVESASQQASQQVDNLQQQLHYVANQRDQAYLQISTLQEQNQMYSMSISNLQMVLEQFQQEKENMVAQETEKYETEVKTLRSQKEKLSAELQYSKEQLEEASDGLAAASRLSEQLDRKEEAIDALREEVHVREVALNTAEDELHKLRSRNDDKVDKLVIKNLFLGYFTTPQNKRHDVLRTIGGVLMFTPEDFEKIDGEHKGWVPGFLKFGGGQKPVSPPTTPVRRSTIASSVNRGKDNSFSEMFVRFLEKESSPPPPAVRLPAEEMARDVQKQKEAHKPAYNPFTAPRHVAMPTSHTETPGTLPSSHILMSTSTPVSHTIPTFAAPTDSSRTPPGSGRSTPAASSSSAILKDVLNVR